MLTPDVQKKIAFLQVRVKKLLKNVFAGDYRSQQKGYGIEFDQLRDYQLGDDIRFIDWKSSARMNKMLVKEYLHEQNKTILVVLDVSASVCYGSSETLKKDTMSQIATVIALAAEYSKARIGILLFSDTIELFIPPALGMAHVSLIINKIWQHRYTKKRPTDIAQALRFLAQISKKDTLLFFISDFIDAKNFEQELGSVAHRYDFIAVRCLDTLERSLMPVGFIHTQDCETGQVVLLDARKASNPLTHFFKKRIKEQEVVFKKHAIDLLTLENDKNFIDTLVVFFAHRLTQ